jgi:capsular exopolysaccharide synthesis family protein
VLGLISGLVFGVGLGIVLDAMNGGFTAPRQVEDLLDLPVLSSVFSVTGAKRTDGRQSSPAYLVAERPLSRYAEAIREIWTALRVSPGERAPQIVGVTSAFPREAKSTTSLSLALAALEFGSRVLLIDADLRRPSIGPTLGLPGGVGLSDLLSGNAKLRDAIVFDEQLGISILSAGSDTTNPSGLLSSARMRALLETLRHHYDVVIIDTPPLGPVTDAVMISQFLDKLVFVCAWSKTPREAVVSALRKLPNLRKVAGVVLTMVDDRKVSYAGQYGYYGLPQFKSYYKG